MFQHFTANIAPEPLRQHMMLYWGGDIAVLVFFCLSGFVIAEAVDSIYKDRPSNFIVNRFLRIVPHFLIAMLISILAHYLLFIVQTLRFSRDMVVTSEFSQAFGYKDVALNFLGFLPIPIRSMTHFDFLSIAWAVRIEMAFYLAVFFYLCVARLFAINRRVNVATLIGGSAAIFIASIIGLLPSKVGLIAYFAFVYGLYNATKGSRTAYWFSFACPPAIIYHFIHFPNYTVIDGIGRDITADLLVLGALLALLTFLGFTTFQNLKRVDMLFGQITYPLYLYHINVLVVVMSVTHEFHYVTYAIGMVLSIVVAYVFSVTVDPLVNIIRDRVRGRRVDAADTVELARLQNRAVVPPQPETSTQA